MRERASGRRSAPENGVVAVFVSIGTTMGDFYHGRVLPATRAYTCSDRSFACVRQDVVDRGNWRTRAGRLEVIVNPEHFCRDVGALPTPECDANVQDDDLRNLITHELGHALSLGDYFCNRRDPENNDNTTNQHPDFVGAHNHTIMNSFLVSRDVFWRECNSANGSPTQLDIDDYNTIYRPARVTGVTVELDGQAVELTWDQSDVFVESHFEIQRANGTAWAQVGEDVPANRDSVTLNDQPGGTQRYRIVAATLALCPEGEDCTEERKLVYGDASVVVSVTVPSPPTAPAGLTISNVTNNGATLHWTGVTGTDGYEVQLDGEDVETTLGEDARSYTFPGLTSGKAHVLGVQATRDGLSSSFATLTLLKPPSGITRGTTTHNSVAYTWTNGNPAGSATAAEVKVGASGAWKTANSRTSHTFNEDLSASTPYTFYFRLKNSQGSSAHRTAAATTAAQPRPPRPRDQVFTLRPTTETETRWIRVFVPPFGQCNRFEEARTKTTTVTIFTTHSWNGTRWVASSHASELVSYTGWSRTGKSEVCEVPIRDGVLALPAGEYELRWDTLQIRFTVLKDGEVELRSRRLESGEDAAVFSVAGGAELVVTPAMLAEDAVAGLAEVTDPTLAALSSSLELVQAEAAEPSVTTETECVVAAKPETGAATVDLADEACVIVSGGGDIRVALGDNIITITLTAERDWLALAASRNDADNAFWFVDLTTGSWIALSPADGTELARHSPADAEGLPALLDAIADSTAVPAATE